MNSYGDFMAKACSAQKTLQSCKKPCNWCAQSGKLGGGVCQSGACGSGPNPPIDPSVAVCAKDKNCKACQGNNVAGGCVWCDKKCVPAGQSNCLPADCSKEDGLSPWVIAAIVLAVVLVIGAIIFAATRDKMSHPAHHAAHGRDVPRIPATSETF